MPRAVDAEMAAQKQPKVLLFDIGGVCVLSPFQAILDYELSLGIPPGWVNYSISKTAPDGFWHRLERGDIPLDDRFYEGFDRDLNDPVRWRAFCKAQQSKKFLFGQMMAQSNQPDPWMFPALQKLKASGRYMLMALSNTVIFLRGHPLFQEDPYDGPVKRVFDYVVSSAHVGMRKPEPRMYHYAFHKAQTYAMDHADSDRGRQNGWERGIKPEDIVFLDDIGENLKPARELGFKTIKVQLGRTYEAVDELEKITGLRLQGDHPRVPIKPKI